MLDNVLIIDADVMFIKKTKFFENGKPLYNFEIGYHQPYYDIMKRVFGFGKQNSRLSGTVHHMMYQREYINELLSINALKSGKEFWKEVMENINGELRSGFSEQDTYFNYMLSKHPDKIKIRKIRFVDFPCYSPFWINLFRLLGYNYVAFHDWLREERFPIIKGLIVVFLTRIGMKGVLKKTLTKWKIFKTKGL